IRFVGMAEKQCQNAATRLAEQNVSERAGVCSHFESNCTQIEYDCRYANRAGGRWWRRRELDSFRPLKTGKLLVFNESRKSQNARFAVLTHVIHTRQIHGASVSHFLRASNIACFSPDGTSAGPNV